MPRDECRHERASDSVALRLGRDTDEVDDAGIQKLAARFNIPGLVRKSR